MFPALVRPGLWAGQNAARAGGNSLSQDGKKSDLHLMGQESFSELTSTPGFEAAVAVV